MVDITPKQNTLREATAQAIVRLSRHETMDAIDSKRVPKGDVYEMSKAAGLLGIKQTPYLLPDCHPIPIEFASVKYTVDGLKIIIEMTVKTIYKTGVEVEAMHGASIVALNMYDMLKPLDKGIEIENIKLLDKKGGKSDKKYRNKKGLSAIVVVCSDSISKGTKEDKAGKVIIKKLQECNVEIKDYCIIADENDLIQKKTLEAVGLNADLVIFTGGTGLSKRDVTPDAIKPLLDREIPGIAETIRNYGQQRTPYSMLSRSLAGVIGDTLVLALPGSTKGAEESMDALFPAVLHLFYILNGSSHENNLS